MVEALAALHDRRGEMQPYRTFAALRFPLHNNAVHRGTLDSLDAHAVVSPLPVDDVDLIPDRVPAHGDVVGFMLPQGQPVSGDIIGMDEKGRHRSPMRTGSRRAGGNTEPAVPYPAAADGEARPSQKGFEIFLFRGQKA